MSDKDKKSIRKEAQDYSDSIMQVRELALELKAAILTCSTNRVLLQTTMMKDGNSKIMGMDSGDIEMLEFDIAGTYGKARHMHTKARELGRKYGEDMPANPNYNEEYQYLYTTSTPVRLSAPARR